VPPVRVKVYGLISFTRRGYLMEAVAEWLVLVAILSFWILGYPHYRQIMLTVPNRTRLTDLTLVLFDAIPWILAGAVLLKVIEMYIVLRAFARKEAAARQIPSAPPPEIPVNADSD
jgi:hypothetical protein